MRWAAMTLAIAAVVVPGPTASQTTGGHAVCIAGDGDWIEKVCFSEAHATPEYGHAILGDTPEWTAVSIVNGPAATQGADGLPGVTRIAAGRGHIFEDIAPRLADIDADGRPDIVVVQSSFRYGARLLVYSAVPEPRLLAATSFIGQPNRWLAPAGIADFDGDGRVEIAYVDRPHLRKDLVFVRLEGDRLEETRRMPGLTNHRIGDDFISGGVRDCGAGPELVLASADWTRLMRVRSGDVEDIGPMPDSGLTIPAC